MIRLRALMPYFFVLGAALLFLPNLFRPGVFIDGLIYGTLSRNMAEGYGSFWSPFFTHTVYYSFKEHPPLAFWVGHWIFKLLGDSFWIERLYSLIWFVIFVGVAFQFKKQLEGPKGQSAYWLPLSFLSVHAIVWSYQHNMLENLVLPIALLTHILYLKSIKKRRFLLNVIIGFLLLTSLFTKGLVTLYPLSFPFWLAIFRKDIKIKRAFTDIGVQLLPLVGGSLLIYFGIEAAKVHLDHYLVHQLISSLKGERIVVRRTFVLERAAIEAFLPVSLFLGGLFVHQWKRWTGFPVKWTPWSSVWLAVGLSSILPIVLSPKQLAFYTVPSLVYLCLFLLEIGRPMIRSMEGIRFPYWLKNALLAGLIVPLSLMIGLHGIPLRDLEMLTEVRNIGDRIGEKEFIGLNPKEEPAWLLKAYSYRMYHITIDTEYYKYKYYLSHDALEDVPSKLLTRDNQQMKLYERIESPNPSRSAHNLDWLSKHKSREKGVNK
jgi:hypothetical protein